MNYLNNLYVYPQSLLYNKPGTYLIRVHCLQSDEIPCIDPKSVGGLPVFYDPMIASKSVQYLSTTILYKAKTPAFYDEFKLELPPVLTPLHHLLFVIVRMQVKPPKKNQPTNPETPVGFAFLPLLKENAFVGQDFELPIAPDLPAHYLSLPATAMRFLDNGKALLKLRIQLSSSLYSHDRAVSKALNLICPTGNSSAGSADKLKNKQSLSSLLDVHPSALMRSLPVVVNHLLAQIAYEPSGAAEDALRHFCLLLSSLLQHSSETHSVLLSYVTYLFQPKDFEHTNLHYQLALAWLRVLSEPATPSESHVIFAPFFFGIIFKSMLASYQAARDKSRQFFSAELLQTLQRLTIQLIWEAQERATSGVVVGKELLSALGLFLCDLFSLVDRGFVIHLVHTVVTTIAPTANDLTLLDFKFAFLRTVSQYRYWVQLNIPVPLNITSPEDLTTAAQGKHFLSSLLLNHVSVSSTHRERAVRLHSVATLRYLLYDHHSDPRFADAESRGRVAEMYFPYILLLSDRIHLSQSSSHAEKRGVLLCLLHILRNVPSQLLRQWWSVESPHRLARFMGTLEMCLEVFEYVGEGRLMQLMGVDQGAQVSDGTKAALEQMYSSSTAVSSGGSPGGRFRNRGKGSSSERFGKGPRQLGFKFDELREMNLAAEASLIVLDVLEMFSEYYADATLVQPPYELLRKIFHLYSLFLKLDQCTEFLIHYHRALRALTLKFADIVFLSKSSAFLAEFMAAVVSHCCCPAERIRQEATVAFFLLMLTNYKVTKTGFVRFGVQATNAVAMLNSDNSFLRRAFGAIAAHLKEDTREQLEQHFVEQAHELMARLNTILEDTRRINQHADDLEMKHDLMAKVAESYATIPDLRVSCLEKLARDHVKHALWTEAGVIYVHLAALSAEFLWVKRQAAGQVEEADEQDTTLEDVILNEGLPRGIAEIAERICCSAREEQLPVELVLRETDSVCESPVFGGVKGLLSTLNTAIEHFHKATLWESVYKASKLLLPLYEYQRQFKSMSDIFLDLQKCFSKINMDEEARVRTLGVYYRVAFFGAVFGQHAGLEYIYKQPLLTRLGEIKERLEGIHRARHGADNIEVWPRNEPIPADKLTPGKGFIQITAVRPYFDEMELSQQRVTYYEQSTDISRFVYETAFTKSAQKHAESLVDQWKRQVILTTEKSFPYIKTRLRVVSSETVEMSPIQSSIDTLEQQTRDMNNELKQRDHNPKNLQRILQGSLLVQVQAGPKAIATAFFDAAVAASLDQEQLLRLRGAFGAFLRACREAVSLNRIIAPEATAVNDQLEIAYASLESCLVDLGIVDVRKRRYTQAGAEPEVPTLQIPATSPASSSSSSSFSSSSSPTGSSSPTSSS